LIALASYALAAVLPPSIRLRRDRRGWPAGVGAPLCGLGTWVVPVSCRRQRSV